MRRPDGWWRRKSVPGKVETYTRWSFHFFGAVEVMALGVPAYGRAGAGLATVLCALVAVHAAVCMLVSSRALDWTRGGRPQPVRLMWTLAAVTALVAITAVTIAGRGPGGEVETAAGTVYGGVMCFGAGVITLGCAAGGGWPASSPPSRSAPGCSPSRWACPSSRRSCWRAW